LLNTLYLYYLRLTDSISKPIFPSAFIFKAFTHELLVREEFNISYLVDKEMENVRFSFGEFYEWFFLERYTFF